MSSAYKTLKTSDITVYPYKVNKSYSFGSQIEMSASGILVTAGVNEPYTPPEVPTRPLAYYRSIRHLYYSRNLQSLSPNTPLSEQTYDQLEETQYDRTKTENYLMYDNYWQSTAASGTYEYDYRGSFPTQSNAEIRIISIPTSLYGENIKPGSLRISSSFTQIVDDGYGNLLISGSRLYAGNVIYPHGIAVVTTASLFGAVVPTTTRLYGLDTTGIGTIKFIYVTASGVWFEETLPINTIVTRSLDSSQRDSFSAIQISGVETDLAGIYNLLANPLPPLAIDFKSELTLYENQVRCHINENEFNGTLNPSALASLAGSSTFTTLYVDIGYVTPLYTADTTLAVFYDRSGSLSDYNDNVTGSDFKPYTTTVGLYSAANELLAVGKLSQPYPIPANTDMTFVVRWDS